jgi:hypothetical protein
VDEQMAGLDVQRLLAGEHAIDDGRILFALGPDQNVASGALLLSVRNYLVPSAFVGLDSSSGETERARPDKILGGQLAWDVVRGDRVTGDGDARLEGGSLVMTYRRPADASGDSWSLKIRPTAGVEWRRVTAGPGASAKVAQHAMDRQTMISVVTDADARVSYAAFDAEFSGPALRVVSAKPSLSIRISTLGRSGSRSPVRVADERSILSRYAVTNVVIWRNTQLTTRMTGSACFRFHAATDDLLIYDVAEECRRK